MLTSQLFHKGDVVYDEFGRGMEVVQVKEDSVIVFILYKIAWPNAKNPIAYQTRYDLDNLSSLYDYTLAHPVEE